MSINSNRLEKLLDEASPGPWTYKFSAQATYGAESPEKDVGHKICSEKGTIMEQTAEWGADKPDADWKLAALAPTLAEEVILLQGIIEDCEKSIAATNRASKQAEHPEYLETLEDYEAAPLGTILEMPGWAIGKYLVKRAPFNKEEKWYSDGDRGGATSEGFAGVPGRVIYMPTPENP